MAKYLQLYTIVYSNQIIHDCHV